MPKQTPDGTPIVHVTQIHKGCGSGCGQGVAVCVLILILLALAKSCDHDAVKPTVIAASPTPRQLIAPSFVRLIKAVQIADGEQRIEIPEGTRLEIISRSGDTVKARYERWAVVLPTDAFNLE